MQKFDPVEYLHNMGGALGPHMGLGLGGPQGPVLLTRDTRHGAATSWPDRQRVLYRHVDHRVVCYVGGKALNGLVQKCLATIDKSR